MRKVIDIVPATDDENMFALCDDGTIWERKLDWDHVKALPIYKWVLIDGPKVWVMTSRASTMNKPLTPQEAAEEAIEKLARYDNYMDDQLRVIKFYIEELQQLVDIVRSSHNDYVTTVIQVVGADTAQRIHQLVQVKQCKGEC